MDRLLGDFEKLSTNDGESERSEWSPIRRGTCATMCPNEEVDYRIRAQLIHPLEATAETAARSQRFRECDRQKMVKCYSRPAAGKELSTPSILRPFPILNETVGYLLSLVRSSSSTFPWSITYEFVSDRLRAVRQDVIIQELDPFETMDLLRPMLAFYFYSKYRCETETCSSSSYYDSHLHSTQMDECADRFAVAYSSVFGQEQKHDDQSRGRRYDETIRCLLLYRLKSFRQFLSILSMTTNVATNDVVIHLARLTCQRNFVRFFRVFSNKLPLRERLALSAGVDVAQMRIEALRVIQKAYGSSGKVPVEKIRQWLAFGSLEDAVSCLKDCGFVVDDDAGLVQFVKTAQEDFIPKPAAHWFRWPDVRREMEEYKFL